MSDIIAGTLFLAPGFLALKLFYLFGAQRPRSQWEWTTWSVIASFPINGAAAVIRQWTGGIAVTWTAPDAPQIVMQVVIASGAGLAGALAWRLVRGSKRDVADRIRMAVGVSAWDETLEDAQRHRRQAEVWLEDGERYLGTVRYAGREDNKAEGWLYLTFPEIYDEGKKAFRHAIGTHGYLVHRDRIKWIRILLTKDEVDPWDRVSPGSRQEPTEST